MNLPERDKKIIWHPFTQEKTTPAPIAIKAASGAYIVSDDDKKYLDLISSWWVNLHGHCNIEIAEEIYKQAMAMEHVMFADFTHAPAVSICEKLKTILPKSLVKFFFSDNGSTAIEVALKMAHQYWKNQGEKNRNLFISFEGGYHGDTVGCMSVGKSSNLHNVFSDLMFDVISVPFPWVFLNDANVEEKEERALAFLKKELEEKHSKISAIILEPLVQGASGMRMYRAEFINAVINIVKKYNILIIFDEVMTGFGRTGTYFAADQIISEPDFICLSKGITGGFLPLALTVTNKKIYNSFLSESWDMAFAHGHSYTANPIACAAASKSFDILVRKETMESINNINQIHTECLARLLLLCGDKIKYPRICGTIAAFNLVDMKISNANLKYLFLKKGLLVRPRNNVVYLIPPYCINQIDLKNAYKIIGQIILEHCF